MEEVTQAKIQNPQSSVGAIRFLGSAGNPRLPLPCPTSGQSPLASKHILLYETKTNQLPDYPTTRLNMKQSLLILTALAALLLLAITASLSLSADSFIAAYLEVEQQPESVSDIVLRSRTTASAPDPHRQNGMWFGSGLLALVLVFVASLFALMFGGDRLLRQWRLTFKRRGGKRGGPASPHHPYPTSLPEAPQPPYLPPPTAPRASRAEQLPPWSDDGF